MAQRRQIMPELDRIPWVELSPWAAILVYVIVTRWGDLKAALSRLYTGRNKAMGDIREHDQRIQLEDVRYRHLQDSWQQDRLSFILEENESFIREQVWLKLGDIEQAIRRTELTLAQMRDSLMIVYKELSHIRNDKDN